MNYDRHKEPATGSHQSGGSSNKEIVNNDFKISHYVVNYKIILIR